MNQNDRRKKKGFFSRLLGVFDTIRKLILNIIFWGLVAFVIYSLIPISSTPSDASFIHIQIEGDLVDDVRSPDYPPELAPYMGAIMKTSNIKLMETINIAKSDDRISGLIIDLSTMSSASLAVLQDLEKALISFQETGKKIFVWSTSFNQNSYYIASLADSIYMDDMGELSFSGYGSYQSYYKKGMDRWGIDYEIFRSGTYKSYTEPYQRSDMSKAVKGDSERWLGNMWSQYTESVEANRGLESGGLMDWINSYPSYMKQLESSSEVALQTGLVDGVGTYGEFSSEMSSYAGYDSDSKSFKAEAWKEYYKSQYQDSSAEKHTVAVITAEGGISQGEGGYSSIGSDSLNTQLDRVNEADGVRALVLRIDSPGGEAFAAETIRRSLARLRNNNITVLVSMGGVAASGGYWIATESDELWASPGTITGSIGVFSMIPQVSEFMDEHLGITGDGVGTTWMSGQWNFTQDLNSEMKTVLHASTNGTYSYFKELVQNSRGIDDSEMARLGGGRIWTGEEALENGLVDDLGTLPEAIKRAATLAHIDDDYGLWFVPVDEYGFSNRVFGLLSEVKTKLIASFIEELSLQDLRAHVEQASIKFEPSKVYAFMNWEQ